MSTSCLAPICGDISYNSKSNSSIKYNNLFKLPTANIQSSVVTSSSCVSITLLDSSDGKHLKEVGEHRNSIGSMSRRLSFNNANNLCNNNHNHNHLSSSPAAGSSERSLHFL